MNFINKFGKTTVVTSVLAASVLGTTRASFASGAGQGAQDQQGQNSDYMAISNTKNPKNMTSMARDGMGSLHNSAHRYYTDNPNTEELDQTAFDRYLKGTNRTNPNDPKENITDSAADGTAFATDHKTYSGSISVDNDKEPLKSVLEYAKEQGKSTGLVTTAEVADTTPAVYAAHVDDRDKKNDIAQQFYNDKINGQHKVDVILGGDSKYFSKENSHLTEKFQKNGYGYVTNKTDLANLKSGQILGLSAEKNISLQIDVPQQNPLLADMEESALSKLEKNDKGFFLMAEGASVDKSDHPNDITDVMSEMNGFDRAFQDAIGYAKNHKDTLVVVTADHSTGGLSVARGKEYVWNPDTTHKMRHSGSYMTEQIARDKDPETVINEGYGVDLPKKQLDKVRNAAKELKDVKDKAKNDDNPKIAEATTQLQDAIQKPINDGSHTGWITYGHTGENINTYAYGPGAGKFRGNIDDIDSAKNIFDFFGQDVTPNQNQ